ncbi:MAG: rRNA maturation RNase YbeY, partial [Chloroflexi bacterium RBG_16_57_9]
SSTAVPPETLPTEARIEDMIRHTLHAEGVAGPLEVTVVISDDETLRDLNHRFRGIDAPTDVLSFAEPTETNGFVLPPDMPRYLGDIVISYPHVTAQAARHGHSPREELDLLVVHGCLHLVGYEDETDAGAEIMSARQEEILKAS